MVIYDFKENILIIPDGVITENPVWQSGYTSGYTDGFGRGYDSGYTDGFASGYTSGKTDGAAEQLAKLVATAVTENGTYSRPDGYSSIQVSVPQSGHTDEELQEAYSSGKTDGAAEQKAKLVATSFTENRTYTRADGWNSVSVNVPQTGHTDEEMQEAYSSGYTGGENAQKAKLVATAVTENGTYSRPDGYSSIQVSVPQTGHTDEEMQQAYASGQTYQKSLLVSTAITANGTYSRPDGYSSIQVSVPQTGHTDQELLDAFNSGYTNGKEEGYDSGKTDGYDSGWTAGYASGYTDGLDDCSGCTSYRVLATYNAPDTVNPIQILCADTAFFAAESPYGTSIEVETGHTFSTSGLNDVYFYASSSTVALNAFRNCDNLVEVEVIDGITTLEDHTFCYCDNLETVKLPDTLTGTLMCFAENPKLTTINIPTGITNLGSSCFDSDISLSNITIPNSVTGIGPACFWGCTSLDSITIPASVTAIGGRCFWDCSGLTAMTFEGTTPPAFTELPQYSGFTLGQTGYTFPIFVPCEAVDTYKTTYTTYAHRITCASGVTAITLDIPTEIIDYGQADAEVESVYPDPEYNLVYSGSDSDVAVIDPQTGAITAVSGGTIVITVTDTLSQLSDSKSITVICTSKEYLTFRCVSAGTLVWKTEDKTYVNIPIQYRRNMGNWETIYPAYNSGIYDPSYAIGDFNVNEVVEVKGNAAAYCYYSSTQPWQSFGGTGYFDIYGDITSLLGEYSGSPSENTFHKLFRGFNVTSAKDLNLSNLVLAKYGLSNMFSNCTHLVDAPELPATTLTGECYSNMFYGCTSLTQAPELPATTLQKECYYRMFCDCTGLITAPVLSATTLADNCYGGMFLGCTSLTTAPALPATALTSNCYKEMFKSCTSLTQAPALPATTLAASCYRSMFADCTSLTTAPSLPAQTLVGYCYNSMFYRCSNLTHIECLATNPDATQNWTSSWTQGVAASGTFVKDPNTTWTRGINGIPSEWTVEDAS